MQDSQNSRADADQQYGRFDESAVGAERSARHDVHATSVAASFLARELGLRRDNPRRL
jgi:hypothetical protein